MIFTPWDIVRMMWAAFWKQPIPESGCPQCRALQLENDSLRAWAAQLEDENWQLTMEVHRAHADQKHD